MPVPRAPTGASSAKADMAAATGIAIAIEGLVKIAVHVKIAARVRIAAHARIAARGIPTPTTTAVRAANAHRRPLCRRYRRTRRPR